MSVVESVRVLCQRTGRICLAAGMAVIFGCAPMRAPVPVGEIPAQAAVSSEDENFGHDVLAMLMERYKLDRNDARIKRVRDTVDHLTTVAGAGQQPWHVYVLDDDNFQNAAATRGNYIFVWTGLLNVLQNDEELAATLAHEIGHVLAGHTKPTPAEEVQESLSDIGGVVAREVALSQGPYGAAAGLAELVVREALRAFLVNPEEQRKELEADQIGLFLIADAGYDPSRAVEFWERMKDHPDFAGFPLQFMSSHPSSYERLEALKAILPAATARYDAASRSPPAGSPSSTSSEPETWGTPSSQAENDTWATP